MSPVTATASPAAAALCAAAVHCFEYKLGKVMADCDMQQPSKQSSVSNAEDIDILVDAVIDEIDLV